MAILKHVLGLGTVLALISTPALADMRAEPVDTVGELFTSQGCSSCPAADKVLKEMAQRRGFLALSWHVTYWDWMGWKDTFADERFSDRQRAYARHMGLSTVYTPQMVINGRMQMPGNAREKIGFRLSDGRTKSNLPAPGARIGLSGAGPQMTLHLAAPNPPGIKQAWLVRYTRSAEVEIERGENAGRTLRYTNIVRDRQLLHEWDGGATEVALPANELGEEGNALIVQQRGPGAILSAVRLSRD